MNVDIWILLAEPSLNINLPQVTFAECWLRLQEKWNCHSWILIIVDHLALVTLSSTTTKSSWSSQIKVVMVIVRDLKYDGLILPSHCSQLLSNIVNSSEKRRD